MTTNIGTIEPAVRAAPGPRLLYLAARSGIRAFESGRIKYGAAAGGAVMLSDASTRIGPLCSIFNFKTSRV